MQGNATESSLQQPPYMQHERVPPEASAVPPIHEQTYPTSPSFAMQQSQVSAVPYIRNQSTLPQPVPLSQIVYNPTPTSYGMENIGANTSQPFTNAYCPQQIITQGAVPPYNIPTSNATFIATPPYQGNFIQNRMPSKKKIYPDNFDGSNKTEWSDYIVHFEQVASLNQWTDAQKAQIISIHLRGKAQ